MARSWRTDEWQRLGWSRSRGTTTKFPQKHKWRDRHKAPAHRGRAETTRQRITPNGAFPRRSSTLTRLMSDAITHALVPWPTKAISLSAQPAVLNCNTSKTLHNASNKDNNYNSTLSNAPDKQRFKQREQLQLNNETRDHSCAEGAVVGLAANTHIFFLLTCAVAQSVFLHEWTSHHFESE